MISIKGPSIQLTHQPEFPEGAALPQLSSDWDSYIYCLKNLTCFQWDCVFFPMVCEDCCIASDVAFWRWVTRKVLLPAVICFRRKLFFQPSSLMRSRKTITFHFCSKTSHQGEGGEEINMLKARWDLSPHPTTAKLEAGVSGP